MTGAETMNRRGKIACLVVVLIIAAIPFALAILAY
jgi:hypothetical protein